MSARPPPPSRFVSSSRNLNTLATHTHTPPGERLSAWKVVAIDQCCSSSIAMNIMLIVLHLFDRALLGDRAGYTTLTHMTLYTLANWRGRFICLHVCYLVHFATIHFRV